MLRSTLPKRSLATSPNGVCFCDDRVGFIGQFQSRTGRDDRISRQIRFVQFANLLGSLVHFLRMRFGRIGVQPEIVNRQVVNLPVDRCGLRHGDLAILPLRQPVR